MAERWSSRLGFLLAAIGAAVGLGNIWRFSAVVGTNGGGAYLVPYLLAAFLFAVPLMILELAVGRAFRVNVVSAFRKIRRQFTILGWVVTGTVVLILSYYLVLTGWVLAFFLDALTGGSLTFGSFTRTLTPLAFFTLSTILTAVIVSFGVKDGIERLASVVMPVIFLLLVLLALYATTLPGFSRAIAFLFQPDFSVLGDPLLWSAAFGQVFFSLSVGQGIMLTYGSYIAEETNLPRSALAITIADIAVAILAGLVIFPIVFTVGLEPALGTELAFTTLPQAFTEMPFGSVVGIAFFGLLFFAALTSAVSLLEVGVAPVVATTQLDRRRATIILTGLVFLIGLPSALSYTSVSLTLDGVRVLDLMDETVGTLGLPVTAIIISLVFGWYQDRDTLVNQLGHPIAIPLIRFVIPAVLVAVTAIKLFGRDFPA
ncbi:MAG: sodium-dependent transporter, partial [Halobacteriales archaeon]|nr:sodium-dependent transporter [Halobacteriales archaeon]